jgi:hypothetical protein
MVSKALLATLLLVGNGVFGANIYRRHVSASPSPPFRISLLIPC